MSDSDSDSDSRSSFVPPRGPTRDQPGGRPFDAPEPGMPDRLAQITGILAIVFGSLELAFGLFGVVMVCLAGVLADEPGVREVSGLLTLIYAVVAIGGIASAVTHLGGGIQLLRSEPDRAWVIAAAVGSIGSMLTIYCIPFGIAIGIMTLIWLTRPPRADALDLPS